ncbi:MAG: glutaminyl-peptide cyclotransferase [Sphingobacteriaceae bacterium]
MKNKSIRFFTLGIIIAVAACNSAKKEEAQQAYFLSPESGTMLTNEDQVVLKLKFPEGKPADSVVYFVDENRLASAKHSQSVNLNINTWKMGSRIITARVYTGGQVQEITTSVVIKPAKAAEKFAFQVQAVFPHDTSSYTQGLEFHDGIFYESDGEYGGSSLRKVTPATGKVVQKVDLSSDKFGEGITVIGNKVLQLTWQENVGLVYDKNTFTLTGEFPYQSSREGWGLCNDGQRIYKSDGSNLIYFLNKDTYREEGYMEVYDHNGAVNQLNELEFIDGKIYANVYQTDRIVIIDPQTGAITGDINLSGLLPAKDHLVNTDVLNGIAFDRATRRLWVTGKKWDKLFQIKLIPAK